MAMTSERNTIALSSRNGDFASGTRRTVLPSVAHRLKPDVAVPGLRRTGMRIDHSRLRRPGIAAAIVALAVAGDRRRRRRRRSRREHHDLLRRERRRAAVLLGDAEGRRAPPASAPTCTIQHRRHGHVGLQHRERHVPQRRAHQARDDAVGPAEPGLGRTRSRRVQVGGTTRSSSASRRLQVRVLGAPRHHGRARSSSRATRSRRRCPPRARSRAEDPVETAGPVRRRSRPRRRRPRRRTIT